MTREVELLLSWGGTSACVVANYFLWCLDIGRRVEKLSNFTSQFSKQGGRQRLCSQVSFFASFWLLLLLDTSLSLSCVQPCSQQHVRRKAESCSHLCPRPHPSPSLSLPLFVCSCFFWTLCVGGCRMDRVMAVWSPLPMALPTTAVLLPRALRFQRWCFWRRREATRW